MAELTPMKRQYYEIKQQYQDCLLFFRLGDFYEMFDDDARLASKLLDLALTTRDRSVENPDERTPMCGIPYHSAETYIARLIAKGYKVAICEQTEDPALAKGLVQRDVIRIITPGTVTESSMLDEHRSNYISAVYLNNGHAGVSFCDVSTGEFCCAGFDGDAVSHVINELGRFTPREVVLSMGAEENSAITEFVSSKLGAMPEHGGDKFEYLQAAELVCRQFGFEDVDKAGLGGESAAVCAVGALLAYIIETQKFDLSHINRLDIFYSGRYMELDWTTRRNLELTETLRSGEKRGSLLWVLDKTKTPMGGRLLRSWVERPLLSVVAIKRRLTAVSELYNDTVDRSELTLVMREISDMERLAARCVYGTAGGRDLRMLANCAGQLPRLKELLAGFKSLELRDICAMDALDDIRAQIDRAICDEPPFSVREGGFIRPGYNAEVDRLHEILSGGKGLLAGIEAREKEKTGIRTLKIGYNKVFGYYIEVSNSFKELVPETYIRKQTLVNGERYITEELKNLEQEILTAGDRDKALEFELFSALRDEVTAESVRVQRAAGLIAELDTLCSLASVAVNNNYCRPSVDDGGVIEIHDGRHPVVERVLKDALFVPNDTYMGEREDRAAIITGPNMAGKSTYMRQVALITLMAQIGSFVPARSARIGIVDRIFTRIGASDDLAGGQSTFMVEMTEVSEILHQATPKSLLILDEIGRGTSTFDGMSIARAVLEFCADPKKLGAKTLFATHYHELTELEGVLPGVKNYSISIKKRGDELIFLRKIVPGGADRSYGIEVAKLAGLPHEVVRRANVILKELEQGGAYQAKPREEAEQVSLDAIGEAEVLAAIRRAQPDTMSPIEAMQLLYELKQKLS